MIRLFPYAKVNNEWSIPDDVMLEIYEGLINDNIIDDLFHDQKTTKEGFITLMQDPKNLPIFAFKDKKPAGMAWLNGMADGWAIAHFAINKTSWGKPALIIANYILSYWFSLELDGKPIFKTLIGITPNSNKKALFFIEKIGFKISSAIPGLCSSSVDGIGIISYLEGSGYGANS